jgi:heptosyltransferase-1
LKILVVKLSSLGDVIQTLPVLHDMQAHLPGVQLDWVVEEAFAGLLDRVPGINRVLRCAQRRWRKTPLAAQTRAQQRQFVAELRAVAYDVVIDFQGLIKSALIARQARLSAQGFSVTYANRSEQCAYEWPVRWLLKRVVPMPKRIHAVARYRVLAAQALGYASTALAQTPARYPWPRLVAGQRAVFFAHGTTRADNQWPLAAWLALGRLCIASGFAVWIPQAGAHEQAFAQQLQAALGPKAQALLPMSLPQVLDLMADCTGVIGVDSGLAHLAVALNLPVVQLFSQPRIGRAGPVGQAHQCAIGGDHVPSVAEAWQAWQACLLAAQALPFSANPQAT